MRYVAGTVLLAALCALPAHSEPVTVTTAVLHAMTPIGSTPTKKEIIAIFPEADPVAELVKLAQGTTVDFGVRLRAIRALPEFCLPNCLGTPAYQALLQLRASIVPNPQQGTSILLLRATIEAIGLAKSGDPDDVARLVVHLSNTNRDIRTTTAYALRDLCQPSAIAHLRMQSNVETVMQVKIAITTAVRDLAACAN